MSGKPSEKAADSSDKTMQLENQVTVLKHSLFVKSQETEFFKAKVEKGREEEQALQAALREQDGKLKVAFAREKEFLAKETAYKREQEESLLLEEKFQREIRRLDEKYKQEIKATSMELAEAKRKIESMSKKIEITSQLEEKISQQEQKITEVIKEKQEIELDSVNNLRSNEINFNLKYEDFKLKLTKKLEENYNNSINLNLDYVSSNFKLMVLQNQKLTLENEYLYDQLSRVFSQIDEIQKQKSTLQAENNILQNVDYSSILKMHNSRPSIRIFDTIKMNKLESIDNENSDRGTITDNGQAPSNVPNKLSLSKQGSLQNSRNIDYLMKLKHKELEALHFELERQTAKVESLSIRLKEALLSFSNHNQKYESLIKSIELFFLNDRQFSNSNSNARQDFNDCFMRMREAEREEVISNITSYIYKLVYSNRSEVNSSKIYSQNMRVFTTEPSEGYNVAYNKSKSIVSDVQKMMKGNTKNRLPLIKINARFTNSNPSSLKLQL